MKIKPTIINQNVADMTEEKLCAVRDVLAKYRVERPQNNEEGELMLKIILESKGLSLKDFVEGIENYITAIKYNCARTTVENLTNLLAADDWKDAKDVVEQWKTIEDEFWYVVPEKDEEDD